MHGMHSKQTFSITLRTHYCTSSLLSIPSIFKILYQSRLYRLVRENNVPGIYYIPYASFSHRLFVWTPRYFRVASTDPEAPKDVPIVKNVRRPPQLLQKVSNKVRRLFFGRQKKPEIKEEETTEKVTEVAKEEPKEKKTEDWMSGMRTIAEETYKHLMDAIATYVSFLSLSSSIQTLIRS
jgi:hypothetical protein